MGCEPSQNQQSQVLEPNKVMPEKSCSNPETAEDKAPVQIPQEPTPAPVKAAPTKDQVLTQYVTVMMDQYDVDGLGFLTPEQFQKFLKEQTGQDYTVDEIEELIKTIDGDCNGVVGPEEMRVLYARLASASSWSFAFYCQINVAKIDSKLTSSYTAYLNINHPWK